MGALDRIVSAGSNADESGRGRSAPGDGSVEAPKAAAGADAAVAVEDASSESAGAPTDPSAQRDAGELGNKARDERQDPVAHGDRNGERTSTADRGVHDETPDERARDRARRETTPRLSEAPSPRELKSPRSVDDASKTNAAPTPPARMGAEQAHVPQPVPVEIRREHVVRERVVERTLVERLVIPQRSPIASEPRTPLPSIVRAPERAESEPKPPAPPREGERTKTEQSEPRPGTPPRAAEKAPAPAVDDRERAELRREPNPPPAPQHRDASRETVARPSAAQGNADDKRAIDRRDERAARDRRDDEKARAPRAAPSRPVAALLTPRAPKPPAAPVQAPKRDAAPRKGQTSGEHPEPQAPPRAASPPRIQISIGRVEVRGKQAEPTVQRSPVASPRAHQIDPGLGFGPLDGGRF